MKIEEIVDFVLKFHNCHRLYEVSESSKNGLEVWEDEKRIIGKILGKRMVRKSLHDSLVKEHGITSKTEKESYRKNMPCNILCSNIDSFPFQLIIYPPYWKLTTFEQIRVIIHEARHIVDYPQTLKPNKDLDYALLREFLNTREPSEVKAILKKEFGDLKLKKGSLGTVLIYKEVTEQATNRPQS